MGDIMGNPGRRAVSHMLAALRSQHEAHFVIANGENAAGGLGITIPTASELFRAGVDVITLGNHSFAKQDALKLVADNPRVIRPANYPPRAPGNGWGTFETSNGESITVINLLGRTFMSPMDCPFRTVDAVLEEIGANTKAIVVDMHAEATSEKVAMGWHLDGRASAVIGTHTHVQTSDERVLPAGTAYLTDAGMTGVRDSVLGLDPKLVVERFITQLPNKFTLAAGPCVVRGALVEIDAATGRALGIQRISVDESEP